MVTDDHKVRIGRRGLSRATLEDLNTDAIGQGRTLMNTPHDPADRWDWSSTVMVLLIVILALALTFEVWVPHFDLH